jgi:hypothetical protein
MAREFHLDSIGLSPLAEIHDRVAGELSQLAGAGAPQTSEVARSFGTIAFNVNNALDGAVQSRTGTIHTTKRSSDTIAGLLGKAQKTYTDDDQHGADNIKAVAQAMPDHAGGQRGSGTPGNAGLTAAPSASADSAGAAASFTTTSQALGQVLGQVGQQVGSTAQSVGQGVAQSLGQVTQQVFQAVSQFSQLGAADHGTAGEGVPGTEEPGDRTTPEDERDRRPDSPDDRHRDTRPDANDPSRPQPPQPESPRREPARTYPAAD